MAKKSGKSGWPVLASKMKKAPSPKGKKNGAGKGMGDKVKNNT